MTPLYQKLVTLIESEGPISIERYMALCLGDPEHGYYMTRDPFGTHGDFTTAPEITQMFGELIGLWIADLYVKLGSPKSIAIAEIGPGRGTLMSDALRAMRAVPNLVESAHVFLIETSPLLTRMQQERLASSAVKITWLRSIDELPDDLTILIANEWLDALPIRQYQRVESGWAERLIGLDQEHRLTLGIDMMRVLPATDDVATGTVRERAVIGETLIGKIATRLQTYGGAFLTIDYGSTHSGFGDTLQAVKNHRFVPVFDAPGESDLTTQVDFAALLRVAQKTGSRVYGPIEQGDFLLALGLQERTSRLMQQADENQKKAIISAFERLTNRDETGMGKLFKAIAITSAQSPEPAGFA